jgi:hypothetical protein
MWATVSVRAATHPIAIRGTYLMARCWGILAGGTGVEDIAAAAMRPAVPPCGGL